MSRRALHLAAWVVTLSGSGFLMLVGWLTVDYYLMVTALVVQFAVNVVYAAMRIRTHLLLVLLYFGIFLFLLTRPVVGIIYGTNAWFVDGEEPTLFSIFVIYLSLVALLVGSFLGSRSKRHPFVLPGFDGSGSRIVRGSKVKLRSTAAFHAFAGGNRGWLEAMRIAALVLLLVCMAFSLVESYQMLRFMEGKTYVEYHLVSASEYSSSFITSVAGMFPYALCAFLATLPDRRSATVALLANVFLTFPELAIGARLNFVGAVLLLVFYYLFRQVAGGGRECWITRRILVLSAVAAPVGLVFLGSINYIRAGTSMGDGGPLLAVADALYKQGVTFKVLQYGYIDAPRIEALGPKFFIIGDLINTVTQGFVGQTFLGCEKLPETNSAALALRGNLYSHTLSYFAHSNYLGGEGWGSSYLLESYADGGYVGVALFSAVLGFALSRFSSVLGCGWFATFFVLLCSRLVFMAPRGGALSWMSFAWSTRFWLFVVCLLVFACAVQFLRRRNIPVLAGEGGFARGFAVFDCWRCRKAAGARLNKIGESR